jgi:hypothetical protein
MLLIIAFLPLAVTAIGPLSSSSGCPTSINAAIPQGLYSFRDEKSPPSYGSMHELHSVMSKCPDITDIQLRIRLLGCSEWPDRWNFPFNQAGGDFYPSRLQTLSLEGYRFDESEWERCQPPPLLPNPKDVYPSTWYRWAGWGNAWTDWITNGKALQWLRLRALPDEQRAKRNLDLWIDAMDFSAVSNLSIRDVRRSESPVLVSSLSSQLPALKVLSISGSWGLNFLRALPGGSLSHLSWRFSGLAGQKLAGSSDDGNTYDIGDGQSCRYLDCTCERNARDADAALTEIWLRHGGPQLESLEFRGMETAHRTSREALPVSQLQTIAAAAPNLRSLTIDLDHDDGSWPEDSLRVLATEFSALESLTVFLELSSDCGRKSDRDAYSYLRDWQAYLRMQEEKSREPCIGDDQFLKPLVNETTATELFAHMKKMNVESGGGKLSKLTLYSGDWAPAWEGPLYISDWIDGRKAWAMCAEEVGEEGPTINCTGKDSRFGDDWWDWDSLDDPDYQYSDHQ